MKPVEGGAERLVARVEWVEDLSHSGTRRERESDSSEWWTVSAPALGNACRRNWHAAAAAGFPVTGAAQWSPDGRRLYFVSRQPYREGHLPAGPPRLARLDAPAGAGAPHFGSHPVRHPQGGPGRSAGGLCLGLFPPSHGHEAQSQDQCLGTVPGRDCRPTVSTIRPTVSGSPMSSCPDGELWKCRQDGSGRVGAGGWAVHLQSSLVAGRKPHRLRGPHGRGSAGEAQRFGSTRSPPTAESRSPCRACRDRLSIQPGPRMASGLPLLPHDGEGSKEQQHVSIVNLETGAVQAVPGSDNLFSVRWSPDGNSLAAVTSDKIWPFLYSFRTQKWTELRRGVWAFLTGRRIAGTYTAMLPTRRTQQSASRSQCGK